MFLVFAFDSILVWENIMKGNQKEGRSRVQVEEMFRRDSERRCRNWGILKLEQNLLDRVSERNGINMLMSPVLPIINLLFLLICCHCQCCCCKEYGEVSEGDEERVQIGRDNSYNHYCGNDCCPE